MGEAARVSGSPVACVLLAEELKALRKRAGLSFAALGAQTLYSKSSWSRYLNGDALPPWKAVQALCELAGVAEPRLRAMWELAEQEWSRRDAVGAGAADAGSGVSGNAVGGSAVAGGAPDDADVTIHVGTLPLPAVAAQTAAAAPATAAQLDAAPPTSAPSTSALSAPSAPIPAPAPRRKLFSHPPGWVWMVVGVVLASAVFGIGSWYQSRSGQPVSSSGVSCVGVSCDGLDAQPTYCGGDPTPLGTWAMQGVTELDLRYNAACRSAWGRVWHGTIGSRVSISVAGKDTRSAVVQDASDSTNFVVTLMVPAVTPGEMLQVCWTPVQGASICRSAPVPR
ncbi:hypothetical protein ABH920_003636 [Catenulispora sp. EB89]|uniref:helix-turn-helix domain-containing protein n=1 Tax=Catenulispora sp. EB89 TaxID=3156257 RepID=UPI003511F498